MATYVTAEQVDAFLEAGLFAARLSTAEDEVEAVIVAAEDDIDRVLSFTLPRHPTTGRKLDPDTLTAAQVAALERATCAQVAFRLEVGDELLGHDDNIGAVPGTTFTGPTPRPPSPAAIEALSGYEFPWRSGIALSPADLESE